MAVKYKLINRINPLDDPTAPAKVYALAVQEKHLN